MSSRKYGLWIVMFFTLMLVGWLTILQFTLPYMGINLKLESDRWMVKDIDPESWAAAEGIEVGDIIMNIDHKSPDSNRLARDQGIFSAKSISVDRNGTLMQFDFSNPYTQPISFNQTVMPMVLFILLFTFSSFIIYKKPNDRAALLLILFLLAIAIGFLAAGGNARADRFAGIVMKLSITLAPAFFIHFLHDYFSRAGIYVVNRKAVYMWYVIMSSWCLIIFAQAFNVISILQKPGSSSKVVFIFFSAGMIFAILIQARMYIRYRNTSHRALLKYMMIGNIGAFMPLILFVVFPIMVFGNLIIGPGVAGSFLLLLPLTYSYLVASNQLLDIEFIMSRLRYYCLIAVIPALVIVAGIGLTFFERTIQAVQWLQTFLVSYIMTGLMQFTRLTGKCENLCLNKPATKT
ncbi:hypothetical protein [Paenibacillus sp. MMS18-CY102]|uniref:hypothetical protein n=1 Tax=Paenibacillus sp. MMS18-CY102 TaxID=2682849 RepID=UPI001925030E|nr:hypothetical protein [Paenibacillus sp. MMS18-CY102]